MGIGGLHLSRVDLAEHEPVGIVIHRFVRRTAAPYHDEGGHLPSSTPPPNFTSPFLTIMSDLQTVAGHSTSAGWRKALATAAHAHTAAAGHGAGRPAGPPNCASRRRWFVDRTSHVPRRAAVPALQLQARPGAQQAARPAVLLVRHGGVAGGAAALGRLSGRRVAGFCAAWWWDIIFQAARTILVIVCAVQCGSSRHHGLPAMRKSKSKSKSKSRRPPTHAVNQLTHRNKNKAEETPI